MGTGYRPPRRSTGHLQFQPKSQTLLADWASAELMNGQIPKAIALLREAVSMKPENDPLREKLATLYEKIAQPQKPPPIGKSFPITARKDKSVLWRLAQTLTAANAFNQAHQAILRYLALDLDEGEQQSANDLNSFLERALSSNTKPAP